MNLRSSPARRRAHAGACHPATVVSSRRQGASFLTDAMNLRPVPKSCQGADLAHPTSSRGRCGERGQRAPWGEDAGRRRRCIHSWNLVYAPRVARRFRRHRGGGELAVHELYPIAAGLLLGSLLQFLRPSWRLPVGLAAAVAIGFSATVISGEYKIGWEFLAIDIPGAMIATAAGFLLTKRVRGVRQRH